MSDNTTSHTTNTTNSGSNGVAIIVGMLVVAVAVIGFVLFGGGIEPMDSSDDVTISIEGAGSAVEGAAQSMENAAEGAAGAVEDAANAVTGN